MKSQPPIYPHRLPAAVNLLATELSAAVWRAKRALTAVPQRPPHRMIAG